MTGEPFEYAIRKDVRNNPVVREIDRERHREMWRAVLLGLFLVAVLLFSVWRQMELVWHDHRAQQLRTALAKETYANHTLRIEREARRAPMLIDDLARRKLRMVQPTAADEQVIERVAPSPPPPRTAVAQR